MGASIKIEGLNELLRGIDRSPENLLKASQTAAKKAASETSKAIKRETPERWRKLTKSKVKKSRTGQIVATMGYYGKRGDPRNRAAVDDWFKLYWKNYGTLRLRDQSHHFDNKVRREGTAAARRRRNNTGQRPEHIFENAVRGWEKRYYQEFDKALDKMGADIWKG